MRVMGKLGAQLGSAAQVISKEKSAQKKSPSLFPLLPPGTYWNAEYSFFFVGTAAD